MNILEAVKGQLITPQQNGRNYLLYLSLSPRIRWLKASADDQRSETAHITVASNLLGALRSAGERCLSWHTGLVLRWYLYAIPFTEALKPATGRPSELWLMAHQGVSSYQAIPVGTLTTQRLRTQPREDLEAFLEIEAAVAIPLTEEVMVKKAHYGALLTKLPDRSFCLQDLWIITQQQYLDAIDQPTMRVVAVEKMAIPAWHW